ncbi:cell division protein FtsK [Kibdelosporangium philippinense]|uniref:Cell division protein FtsK n=1 Tax=Kibdelosporangium philippinense TaxID=211113 RepID=A0ABS8ZKE1_9PSEU|nr:FtsK/SpoIIIE domain-containing protein [Kibdelosporangium philippinense]MCE7008269.1 cell division protein FtsK [Kibdelosporangium philippinense]
MRDSRWVDPAPLEVARPRLPWWTMLPGWVKLVVSPLALAWLLIWSAAKVIRLCWYYPVLMTLLAAALWLDWWAGHYWTGALASVLIMSLVVWWWRSADSYTRWCRWLRTEVRRLTVYAWDWRTVMRLSNLAGTAKGREYRPKLKRVRSEGWRDKVRVKMIKGQAPEQWAQRASGLAHSFHANSCRVRVIKPGRIELDLIHSDPLTRPIPLPAMAAAADLKRITVGKTETGKPWRIRLLGNQILVVGVQGAGKGSLLWSVVWALAPLIKTGTVRLYGIDPKGGMELGQCPEVFHKVVYDNGPDAVALLEEIANDVRRRAGEYRGLRRLWTRESGEPFTLLIVDELADVIAYQTDKKLKERAQAAIQTITSQGRAPGFATLALVQDPRKEIVPFRNLFTTRIAMRLDEPAQVDMVLGDGVRERGAEAHEISELTPGVAWAKEDGKREPMRARAFYATDDDLWDLRAYINGWSAEVLQFPGGEAA